MFRADKLLFKASKIKWKQGVESVWPQKQVKFYIDIVNSIDCRSYTCLQEASLNINSFLMQENKKAQQVLTIPL